jgi:tRNA pseudouridine13 synthase
MKTLYCHALQSYVWNKVVSRRIRDYGLVLVEGDIVGVHSK